MAFIEMMTICIHLEHLIVICPVELPTADPRGSPMPNRSFETFYRHFEAAISFAATFETYTKDDSLFSYSAKHFLLPSIN